MVLRILLPIMTYPDVSPASSLPRALDLAATLGAHLTAIIQEVDIPPINNPVADLVLHLERQADAAERLSRSNGAQLAQELKHQCERLGLPIVIETLRARWPSGDLLAARARCHDLTMLVCLPESPDHALLEEECLFGSGGPVVIIPATDNPTHMETVAIAWDGSRAAARSLRDAMPLLAKASRVRLLTCSDDKPISQTSITEVLAHLASHEIDAVHVPLQLGGKLVGDALQAGAIEHDAGLLVMGAYGHNRLREFILGGATASVLASPRLPLFMSH